MYIVVKEVYIPSDFGGRRETRIDRIVNSLEEVKSGEIFFKCNIKE